MIRVVVCEAQSKTKLPAEGGYVPSDKGEGGSWNVSNEAPLTYYYLNVNGIALGGVYVDKAAAEQDAGFLRTIG